MKAADDTPTPGRTVAFNDPVLTVFAPADATGAYDIRYCDNRYYLQFRLSGTWDDAIFDRFAADYRAIIAHMAGQGGVTHLFVDATAFAVQEPELMERFPALIAAAPRHSEQRSACVAPSLVNRAQARPSGDLINARYFRTAEGAADWLFSDEA